MTMMRVSLAGTELTADDKQRLTTRLIDAFSAVEVGRDGENRASLVQEARCMLADVAEALQARGVET